MRFSQEMRQFDICIDLETSLKVIMYRNVEHVCYCTAAYCFNGRFQVIKQDSLMQKSVLSPLLVVEVNIEETCDKTVPEELYSHSW